MHHTLETISLGIVQGLGEFLPISSSAHLILLPWFFGWNDQGLAFDVALHLGTLIAVVTYYRKIWLRLLKAALFLKGSDRKDRELLLYVIIATIPGIICGLLLKKYAETVFRDPLLIACTLSSMGLLLWWSDIRIKERTKSISTITLRDALIIGFAQCFALIPGFSRSGTTITAALFLRFRREEAAHFSFLMSVPITAGAVALQSLSIVKHKLYSEVDFWLGIGSAGIVGFLAIAFLVKYVSKRSFLPFAIYRALIAAVILYIYFAR